MMKNNNFCAFILTHGRPDKVYTYNTLKKSGYTGPIYLICDDEDKCLEEYKAKFDNVLVFNKDKVTECIDVMDTFKNKKVILYARNVCFYFAKKLGYKYFIELDDDYTQFSYRHYLNASLKNDSLKCLDSVIDLYLNFLENTNTDCVAFSQAGDFVGGIGSNLWKRRYGRKIMNSFICNVNKPFKFYGTLNEDVNTYVYLGSKGYVFFTFAPISLTQMVTQANSAGMTDIYLKFGTYVKSFYSVMIMPSAVKISSMGDKDKRIHHHIYWDHCVPKILNEKYKKNVLTN